MTVFIFFFKLFVFLGGESKSTTCTTFTVYVPTRMCVMCVRVMEKCGNWCRVTTSRRFKKYEVVSNFHCVCGVWCVRVKASPCVQAFVNPLKTKTNKNAFACMRKCVNACGCAWMWMCVCVQKISCCARQMGKGEGRTESIVMRKKEHHQIGQKKFKLRCLVEGREVAEMKNA